jgi:hypothetical protein
MPKSEHSYYLMQGILKDDDWRFFTQLMYDKIDTLADKLEEIDTKMRAHEVLTKGRRFACGSQVLKVADEPREAEFKDSEVPEVP